MAASRVACLARPNGAPYALPYEQFRTFACAFHMETVPKLDRTKWIAGRRDAMRRAAGGCDCSAIRAPASF
ncbi:hypothetical protein D5R55_05870 [Burkholderia cenocepacia]|uniref:Uncharacterized protein n=1 Tax=Burkholderia cenocepacia TaxID=95486 RepID=A0A3Q9F722_9BURK|nr:hypothetical protein D5R55_05870 [Burkholderia cenocepacia]